MPPFRRNAPANPSIGDQINQKLTFFGMVGVVMTALKLKDRWDDCESQNLVFTTQTNKQTCFADRQLPEDEEGAVRLPSSPNTQARELVGGDDDISMLDTQIPRPKRVRRKGCCMCCGIECVSPFGEHVRWWMLIRLVDAAVQSSGKPLVLLCYFSRYGTGSS